MWDAPNVKLKCPNECSCGTTKDVDSYRQLDHGHAGVRPRSPLFGAVFDVQPVDLLEWSSWIARSVRGAGSPLAGRVSEGEEGGTTGQAQGSTGRARMATFTRATDPTMEQGLEVRLPSRAERGKPREASAEEEGRGGKVSGERDGRQRSATVTRAHGGPGFVPATVAVGGGKASKGRRYTAGNPVSRQEETR
jgi:hypothetical protein